MSILFSWLDPLRTIFIFLDGVAYSFLDNAYNILIELSSAELLNHQKIYDITLSLYVLVGLVAFFRLALVLVNSIIDPEKLNEKGKGLSNIFFRVVGMIVLLAVTPFLFQMSYDITGKLVSSDANKNVIFQVFLGDKMAMGGYENGEYNAGKALQNIVLSSLITVDKSYLTKNGATCQIHDDGKVFDEDGKDTGFTAQDLGTNGHDECGYVPLKCVPDDENSCTMYGGYYYNDKCDSQKCKNAVTLYNNMYRKEDMSPTKLTQYVNVSEELENEDTGEEENVYVYSYMVLVTTAAGIFLTYMIISFAIDIAVRMFELIVLEILSPLFIATFVDPNSAQNGPFKNWLSAVGKSYVSLYIKLAIIALFTFFLMIVGEFTLTNDLELTSLARIFLVIGLLIFAKKAPKWINGILGIKDEGLGGLGIGKKLGGMALAGGLVSKGLDAGKKLRNKAVGAAGKSIGRKLSNAGLNIASGLGAHHTAMKKSKGSGKKYSQRLKEARQASAAARAGMRVEQAQATPRMFDKVRNAYDRGVLAVNPNYKNSQEAKIDKLSAKLEGKLDKARESGVIKSEQMLDELGKIKNETKKAKVLTSGEIVKDSDGKRLQVTSPSNGEKVFVNPQGDRELNSAINYATSEDGAYDALGRNLALAKGYTTDSTGKVIDSNGKVIASSMSELGIKNLSFTGQLAVKDMVAKNLQKEVSDYKADKEQLAKSQQDYASGIQMLNDTIKSMREQAQGNPQIVEAYNVMEKYANQQALITSKHEEAQSLQEKMDKLLAGRNFNDLSESEQSRYIQINNDYKQTLDEYNSGQTELRKISKDYSDAQGIVANFEKQYGVSEMRENIENSRRAIQEYSKYVTDAENRFENTSVIDYNDDGTPKKDSSGNVVTVNPYKVKINGTEYSPKDNFTRIDEIINALQIKSSKASKKADEKLTEELKKLESTSKKDDK